MTKDDLAKIGLNIDKCTDHYLIKVANWEKFFPLINLPVDGPLLQFAQRNWSAYMLHYNCSEDYVKFDICICSTSAFYHTTSHSKDKVTYFPRGGFIFGFNCPYDKDDIRRYSWFTILNQFNYSKIFKNIRKTLFNAYFPGKSLSA